MKVKRILTEKIKYCIAGIIVKEPDELRLDKALGDLKAVIWNNINDNKSIVLHQKDVEYFNNRSNKKDADNIFYIFK